MLLVCVFEGLEHGFAYIVENECVLLFVLVAILCLGLLAYLRLLILSLSIDICLFIFWHELPLPLAQGISLLCKLLIAHH